MSIGCKSCNFISSTKVKTRDFGRHHAQKKIYHSPSSVELQIPAQLVYTTIKYVPKHLYTDMEHLELLKTCVNCQRPKPLDQFHPRRGSKPTATCLQCRESKDRESSIDFFNSQISLLNSNTVVSQARSGGSAAAGACHTNHSTCYSAPG